MVTAAVQVEIISPSCAGSDRELHLHMLRFWPESGYFMEIRICDLLPVSSPPQPHTDRQGSAGPTAPRPPTHTACPCPGATWLEMQRSKGCNSPPHMGGGRAQHPGSRPLASACSRPCKMGQLVKPCSQQCRGGDSNGPRVALGACLVLPGHLQSSRPPCLHPL